MRWLSGCLNCPLGASTNSFTFFNHSLSPPLAKIVRPKSDYTLFYLLLTYCIWCLHVILCPCKVYILSYCILFLCGLQVYFVYFVPNKILWCAAEETWLPSTLRFCSDTNKKHQLIWCNIQYCC